MRNLIKQIKDLQEKLMIKINPFNKDLFYFEIQVTPAKYGYGSDSWEVIEKDSERSICVVDAIGKQWEHGNIISQMSKGKQDELRKIAKEFKVELNN